MNNKITGNLIVDQTVHAKRIVTTEPCIRNANIADDAAIAASKLEHESRAVYAQGSATTAAAATQVIHVCDGVGEVIAFSAGAVTPMTSGGGDDREIDVDLKKNGSSILTAVLILDKVNLAAARETVDATLAAHALAAGDVLEVVITVSGSTGTQASGFFCRAVVRESPII